MHDLEARRKRAACSPSRLMAGAQRAALVSVLLFFVACQHQPPVIYVIKGPPRVARVPKPPPEIPLEEPTASPGEAYVWRGGFWGWTGNQYRWVAGEWTIPPDRDFVFVPPAVAYVNNYWIYHPGFWCPPDGRTRRGPPNRVWTPVGAGSKQTVYPRSGPSPRDVAQSPPTPNPPKPDVKRRRAPPSEQHKVRRRAPAAPPSQPGHVVRRRAPAAPKIEQQSPRKMVKRRPTIVLSSANADGATVDIHRRAEMRRGTVLQTRSGTRSSKPRPKYTTDSTGAIVLVTGPRRFRRHRVIIPANQTRVRHQRSRRGVEKAREPPRRSRGYVVTPRVSENRSSGDRWSGNRTGVGRGFSRGRSHVRPKYGSTARSARARDIHRSRHHQRVQPHHRRPQPRHHYRPQHRHQTHRTRHSYQARRNDQPRRNYQPRRTYQPRRNYQPRRSYQPPRSSQPRRSYQARRTSQPRRSAPAAATSSKRRK
jgi:hypothetical protein